MTQENNSLSLFNAETTIFNTIPNNGSRKDQAKIYNMLQNPGKALGDCINQEIEVVHMIAHPVELVSEQTGEIETHMRVILVDKKGESYATVSDGITNSLRSIFQIVGQPPFVDEPLKIKVLQKKGKGQNKFLTLELI